MLALKLWTSFQGDTVSHFLMRFHLSVTHHKDKGHEPTENCEEDVPPLIAEAATSLKENEGRNKQRSNCVE